MIAQASRKCHSLQLEYKKRELDDSWQYVLDLVLHDLLEVSLRRHFQAGGIR